MEILSLLGPQSCPLQTVSIVDNGRHVNIVQRSISTFNLSGLFLCVTLGKDRFWFSTFKNAALPKNKGQLSVASASICNRENTGPHGFQDPSEGAGHLPAHDTWRHCTPGTTTFPKSRSSLTTACSPWFSPQPQPPACQNHFQVCDSLSVSVEIKQDLEPARCLLDCFQNTGAVFKRWKQFLYYIYSRNLVPKKGKKKTLLCTKSTNVEQNFCNSQLKCLGDLISA